MPISVVTVSILNRSHEGNELAGDDPVEVTVLDSFIILILFHIESTEVIPTKPDGILEALQDMQQSAIVEAVTFGGITVMFE